MADQDEGGRSGPYNANGNTGGGSNTSGSPFLRKLGPLPVWAWMLITLGLAIAYSSWRKNKQAAASASTQQSNTAATAAAGASQTPPFIIQNYTTQAPGGAPVTQPTGTGGGMQGGNPPHGGNPVSTSAGNEEPYLYGHKQLDYISSHGYAANIITDVTNAYQQVSHSQGVSVADSYHYSWIGPGNVQAIPKGALSVSQILQNLP